MALREDFKQATATIEYFNDDLNCNSYCFEQLFSWGMPLEKGRPIGTCNNAIQEELYLVFMFPAIVALIAGITSGIALPTQYLLWRGYPQNAGPNVKTSQKILDTVVYTDGEGNADHDYADGQHGSFRIGEVQKIKEPIM